MTASNLEFEAVRKLADAAAGRRGVTLIAIDGKGGSGKSSLGRALAGHFPDAIVIEMDDFYLPRRERAVKPSVPGQNYDRDRLISQVLKPLHARKDGRYQRYDWNADALAEWHVVRATGLVIVEGVYSTSTPLRPYFDLRIWVEASYDTRLRRGLLRDGEEMRSMWVDQWMPAEDAYASIERPAEQAHLIVSGEGEGDAASPHSYNVLRFT